MGRSNLDCHCGGRRKRLNLKHVPPGQPNSKGFVYEYSTWETIDITPGYATYRCDKCQAIWRMKLRQPKPKQDKTEGDKS